MTIATESVGNERTSTLGISMASSEAIRAELDGRNHFASRPYLPPVPCEAWCVYQDDRADKWHRDDQYCHTEQSRIDLTLETEIEGSHYSSELGQWIAGPDYVEVWLHKIPGEPVEVRFSRSEAPEVRLTVDEAKQLMTALFLLTTTPGIGTEVTR